MKTISIASAKGGTGKTTTAICLAQSLSRKGKRVLLIDCDSQANATDWLGVQPEATPGTFGFMAAAADLASVVVKVEECLDLLPASRALSGLDAYLLTKPRPADVLRKRLQGVEGYDFILCDTPPSFSQITLNALMASEEVIVPVNMEYFGIEGLRQVLETVRVLKEEAEHTLKVRAVVPTFFDSRNKKSAAVVELLREKFGSKLTPPARSSVRLSEAPSFHRSIFDFDPDGPGAEDYTKISEVIFNANN